MTKETKTAKIPQRCKKREALNARRLQRDTNYDLKTRIKPIKTHNYNKHFHHGRNKMKEAKRDSTIVEKKQNFFFAIAALPLRKKCN